jgi:hypothetical protein
MKSGLGVVIHYTSRYEETLLNGSFGWSVDLLERPRKSKPPKKF